MGTEGERPMNNKAKKKQKRTPQPLFLFTPTIITFNEKHGNSVYACPTEAHLHAVALSVLTDRCDPKYTYYWNPSADSNKEREYGTKAPDMSLEAAEALPAGSIRDAALHQHKLWKADQDRAAQAQEFWDSAQRAMAERDGALAWILLEQRGDHEYEGYERNSMEMIDILPRPEPRHGRVWVDQNGTRWVYDGKEENDWIRHIYPHLSQSRQVHRGQNVTFPKLKTWD